MFFPVSEWLPAYALTVAIELPVAVILLRTQETQLLKLAVIVCVANLATHLALWYVFTQLLDIGTPAYLLVGEGFVILAEGLAFWAALPGVTPSRVAIAALAANTLSFLIGEALRP